nr:hypothetical protein Q903MT_gene6303 [Picea sitchensis]
MPLTNLLPSTPTYTLLTISTPSNLRIRSDSLPKSTHISNRIDWLYTSLPTPLCLRFICRIRESQFYCC